MLNVHSIETFWTQEWPWIRVIIFMQWCLMKCKYCHNPDTIAFKKNLQMSDEEIISVVNKVKPYFWTKWGVTFSGWECLTQAGELISTFKKLKELWYHIVIDTNWFVFNKDVEELLKYTDLVLLDIKHFYENEHIELTWVSNKPVLAFADYLEKIWKSFWIRHVLVPGYTDDKKHLFELWAHFKDFKSLQRLEILPYHTLWVHKWRELWMEYQLSDVVPPTAEALVEAKEIFEQNIKEVYIRR